MLQGKSVGSVLLQQWKGKLEHLLGGSYFNSKINACRKKPSS